MATITNETQLNEVIQLIKIKRQDDAVQVTEQFKVFYQSIKPINLIKSVLKEASSNHDIQDNLLNSSLGVTSGFIIKKIYESFSTGPINKLIGTALMLGISTAFSKNPGIAKGLGKKLTSLFKTKNKVTPTS